MQGIKKAEATEKQRESGLELYRIIVMLAIVAHHYVVNSGLMDRIIESPITSNSVFLILFGAWGKTGINCFMLITGYFMCKSNITLKKYAKLLLEVMLYKVVFFLVFLLSGYEPLTIKGLLKAILPYTAIQQNFTGCFLTFYLFIPFLNALINAMSRRMHLCLVALCLFVYTILGSIPFFDIDMNYVTWFIVLYFISSYIRLYAENFLRKYNWGGITIGILMISGLCVLACNWIGRKVGMPGAMYYFVSDSNKILAVLLSISSFLYFKNLRMKYTPWINVLGGSTFGVLLIHANSDTMRRWLWKDVLNYVGMFDSGWIVVHAVMSTLAVFAICSLIDIMRIRFIEKPFFKKIVFEESRLVSWWRRKEEGA